jgi:hypothetical protein
MSKNTVKPGLARTRQRWRVENTELTRSPATWPPVTWTLSRRWLGCHPKSTQ